MAKTYEDYLSTIAFEMKKLQDGLNFYQSMTSTKITSEEDYKNLSQDEQKKLNSIVKDIDSTVSLILQKEKQLKQKGTLTKEDCFKIRRKFISYFINRHHLNAEFQKQQDM